MRREPRDETDGAQKFLLNADGSEASPHAREAALLHSAVYVSI